MHFLQSRLNSIIKQKGSKLLLVSHGDLAATGTHKFRPDYTPEQREVLRGLLRSSHEVCRSRQSKFLEHAVPFNMIITSKQRACKETAHYLLTGFPEPLEAYISNYLFPKVSEFPILNAARAENSSVDDILQKHGNKEFTEYTDILLEEIIKIIEKKQIEKTNVCLFGSSLPLTALS
jgi:hypothetical protein